MKKAIKLLEIILLVFITFSLYQLAYGEDYNRTKHFGSGWIDADNDCQDTRQEVLIEESVVSVQLEKDGCRVKHGIWICPYTGEYFFDPGDLDVDHLVPLKEAWLSGADKWTKEERVAYANDLKNPQHLIAVKAGANRSKGAKDPAQWMPNKSKLKYLYDWIKVKQKYNLNFDAEEVWFILETQRKEWY